MVEDQALQRSADFWDESRHDSLAERELKIYHMVDTIKTLPALKHLCRYYHFVFYRI